LRRYNMDDKLLATEAAANEARRNLELARVARDGLADADQALTEREQKLNDSWRTLQAEVAALLQGDFSAGGDGDGDNPNPNDGGAETRVVGRCRLTL